MAVTKHGLSRTPEYRVWASMRHRCVNPLAQAYENYGGRGITVDPAWIDDVTAFLRDMGPRPSPRHSLDRRDNDGPYSKDNCRWATDVVQNQNRRFATLVSAFGETKNLAAWARERRIGQTTLHARLFKHMWPPEKALTEPASCGHANAKRKRNERGQYA